MEKRVEPWLVPRTPEYTRDEPRRHELLELAEREVGDVDLPDLRHDDEALARDVERVAGLHVAGEDEHEPVAGAEAVVGVDRAG